MAGAVSIVVLGAFSGCLEAFQVPHAGQRNFSQGHMFATTPLFNVVDSTDVLSNLETIKESSFLSETLPVSFSSLSEMTNLQTLFDLPTIKERNDTDIVPISIAPFKVILKSIHQGMPLTTMEFPHLNFTFPINKEERFSSVYTPISLLYPEPKSYSGEVMPDLEEIYDNPRMIKGFEQAHAHPANREVALHIMAVGKKSLQVIRKIPQLRALGKGEPGIPINISEMTLTISGYPYGDSTIVFPASKFMIPYPSFV